MKNILTAFSLAALLSGCYYDNKEDLYPVIVACDSGAVTYSGKVLSIIQSNCYACHTTANTLGNMNLEGYSNLKVVADNGKLAGVIEHQNGFSPMPQGGTQLNSCDISVIKKWISDGAPNN